MSSLEREPGETVRFKGLIVGVRSYAPWASTLDLRIPLPVLSPQNESLMNDLRTPPSIMGRLSVGVPSSSNTQDRGALTVGSSVMLRHLDATSFPRESFQRLLPYLTFSPWMAEPTADIIMSPSSLGGRIMDIFLLPLNSLHTAAASALSERALAMATGSRSKWVPWNVSIPSPGWSLTAMDVKCP